MGACMALLTACSPSGPARPSLPCFAAESLRLAPPMYGELPRGPGDRVVTYSFALDPAGRVVAGVIDGNAGSIAMAPPRRADSLFYDARTMRIVYQSGDAWRSFAFVPSCSALTGVLRTYDPAHAPDTLVESKVYPRLGR